jgi:amidohydrolase
VAATGTLDRKAQATAAVDGLTPELVALSHEIHAHPELGYEERIAAQLLADALAGGGFVVERGAYGIETSFAGRLGRPDAGGPHVVVCCEYDALPKIGHGCGHNIIGAAGVGAGLALAPLVDELGGRLTVLGCPAEELGGGGKIALLERGAFADADVAMMVHPSIGDVGWAPHIANTRFRVEMHGKAAHAAAAPWNGRNALDALVAGYTAMAALRQHVREGEKMHGIITAGGDAENVVPEYTAGTFQVRAPNARQLAALQERVKDCFRGAATQTGCRCEITDSRGYEELLKNEPLAQAYRANGEALGRRYFDHHRIPLAVAGSTDMGNVSKAVPTVHAMVGIAPAGVAGHSDEFREAARSPEGDAGLVHGAKALAMTAIDVFEQAQLVADAKAELAERQARHSRDA